MRMRCTKDELCQRASAQAPTTERRCTVMAGAGGSPLPRTGGAGARPAAQTVGSGFVLFVVALLAFNLASVYVFHPATRQRMRVSFSPSVVPAFRAMCTRTNEQRRHDVRRARVKSDRRPATRTTAL
jgi:hypothetical protein